MEERLIIATTQVAQAPFATPEMVRAAVAELRGYGDNAERGVAVERIPGDLLDALNTAIALGVGIRCYGASTADPALVRKMYVTEWHRTMAARLQGPNPPVAQALAAFRAIEHAVRGLYCSLLR